MALKDTRGLVSCSADIGRVACKPGSAPSAETASTGTLTLGFPASNVVRNTNVSFRIHSHFIDLTEARTVWQRVTYFTVCFYLLANYLVGKYFH